MSIVFRVIGRGPSLIRIRSPVVLVTLGLVLSACADRRPMDDAAPTVSVDFSRLAKPSENADAPSAQRALRIAIAGMTSPQATLRYYQELLDYVGKRLRLPARMILRKTYQEVNDLLANGELDAAFLCSGGFVAARTIDLPEIIAVPVVRGKTTYQAYIIVHRDSQIYDFRGLRQRSFAFTDPLSNTGWLYPVSKLNELGVTPSSFFSQITYTYGHDRSIEAVAGRLIDGASVDSLIYEYLAGTRPEEVRDLRIIERSPKFGIPPIVASPRLAPDLRHNFRAVLLSMNEDAEGARILRKLVIERFVQGDKRAYDSIRRMADPIGPWRP